MSYDPNNKLLLVAVSKSGQMDTTQIYEMSEADYDLLKEMNQDDDLGLELHAEYPGIMGRGLDAVMVDFKITTPAEVTA